MANFSKQSGAAGHFSQSANSLTVAMGQKSQFILWGGGPGGAPLVVATEPVGKLQLKENRTARRGAHERVFDIVGTEAGEIEVHAFLSADDRRDYTPPLRIIVQPTKAAAVVSTGALRLTSTAVLASNTVWSPVELSLISEMSFDWGSVTGGGRIFFFDLDEAIVPNKFGVLVPDGLTNFQNVHVFFHPTPKQQNNPYDDVGYFNNPVWRNIFHYLTGQMGVQFCAARSNQVLFMPLMSNGSAGNCGTFPQRWEAIISAALGQIAGSPPVAISSVVVSSFSSGIGYSAAFRQRAGLGTRLRGIIDFDGIISTNKRHSMTLSAPAVRMWQTDVAASQITQQAAANLFPLPHKRWVPKSPYRFKGNIMMQMHGTIPVTMMFIAARRTKA